MAEEIVDYIKRSHVRARLLALSYVLGLMALAVFVEFSAVIPLAERPSIGLSDRIQAPILLAAITVGWMTMLGLEWRRRHFRDRRLRMRRFALWAQGVIVLCCGSEMAHAHDWSWFILVVATNLAAIGVWHLWIKSNRLHPVDQAKLDRLVKEYEEQRVPEVIDRHRSLQFEAAAARYRLPDPPTPVNRGVLPLQSIEWSLPTRRHEPKVYFIVHGNRIKIGTTVDIRKRVRALSLRAGNVALLLPGGADVERSYHDKFAALRINDTEWFTAEPELINFIAAQQLWED